MSELESSEEARRETDSRYRLASRAVFEAIWDWNPRTGITSWSEGLRAVFGYTPGEMGSGADWWSERLHPEDRERVVEAYQRALEGGAQEWTDEYRFRRKDGTYCWVIDRGHLERGADGRPIRVVGAMMDITERKRAEEELGRRVRQQAAVARLGLTALGGAALQALFDEAVDVGFSEFAEAVRTLGLFWLVLNEPAPPGRTGA
jgi:PAS domain S-box-containing protein